MSDPNSPTATPETAPTKTTPEQAAPGQVAPEQAVSEQVTPEQAVSEQVTPEQAVSEQVTPEQAVSEQVTPEQTVSEQVTPEQTVSEQAAAKEALVPKVKPWLDNLPYTLRDFEGLGGELKSSPEDFVVEEIPAYFPCGEGSHLFLKVRKRLRNTQEVIEALGRAFGVRARDVGSAGFKDRQAVTTQWFSVPCSAQGPSEIKARIEGLLDALSGVEVLEATPHTNKLKRGHLNGNYFEIVLRGTRVCDLETLQTAAFHLESHGFPNYYGTQRFGRFADNPQVGMRMMQKGSRPRKRRDRLIINSVQSAVFNVYTANRLREMGNLQEVLFGDVLAKRGSGGSFLCEDVEVDQARMNAGELVVTGPMPGPKARPKAEGIPATWEVAAMEAVGVSMEEISKMGKAMLGQRRPLVIHPQDLEIEILSTDEREDETLDGAPVEAKQDLKLTFRLPPGCYATTLLKELMG